MLSKGEWVSTTHDVENILSSSTFDETKLRIGVASNGSRSRRDEERG
jgi:hypothetical protein